MSYVKKSVFFGGLFRPDFLILGIAIILGVLLVGGITPFNFQNTPSSQGEFIAEPVVPAGGDKSLQLKTIKFKQCSGTVTIDLLLDRTGSMRSLTPSGKTKISRLKEAVIQLTDKLSDSSIVGIQSFSSLPDLRGDKSKDKDNFNNDVPISYYKDVKSIIPAKINALMANGNTPTHNALAYSYGFLQQAVPLYKDRQFNFIFVSDGEPVPPEQDPRLFTPNPASQIKALGVNEFSLAVYDSIQTRNPKLAELLKSIASKPGNYYEANNADQVSNLLQQILTKICDEPAK